ncbi:hypothetical protein BD779DRAFT_1666989 [Infundibulicybe gibba]|nr:hypothetical protein BD779DRAFT_1666989 [Infundibulicybe gibba]
MKTRSGASSEKIVSPPKKKRKSEGSGIDVEPPNDVRDEGISSTLILREQSRKGKGKLGRLAGLLDLPIDVLFEIFGRLRPYELLKLARMTKEFRRMLMHRSSTTVWRSALESIPGLPPCPPEMTEPQWVNLVFDPHCHFCFTTGVRNAEWKLRVRICGKCAKEHMRDVHHLNIVETLIPHRPAKRYRREYLHQDFEKVRAQYEALKGEEERSAFVAQRGQYLQAVSKHAVLCEIWAKEQTQDRSIELQRMRDDRRAAIISKLTDLGWGFEIESIQYPECLEEHKLVNKPARLTDRVWKNIEQPMLEFMQKMRGERLRREHAALVIERKRTAIKILRAYKNGRLPCTELLPEPVDFCDFPPVKAILEKPSEVEVTEASFSDIVSTLPTMIEDWKRDVHQRLNVTIESRKFSQIFMPMGCPDYGDWEDDDDIPSMSEDEFQTKLNLATTVFQCRGCRNDYAGFSDYSDNSDDSDFGCLDVNLLFYPGVLGHTCLTRAQHSLWFSPYTASQKDDSTRLLYHSRNRTKWSSKYLYLDKVLSERAAAVIRAAGQDPKTATVQQMDTLDTYFACRDCLKYSRSSISPVFGWRDMIKHHAENHSLSATTPFTTMTAAEAESSRTEEEPDITLEPELGIASFADLMRRHSSTAKTPKVPKIYLCVQCRDLPEEREATSLTLMLEHLTRHDIEEPELNRHYYIQYGASPINDRLPVGTFVRFPLKSSTA